MTIFRCSALVLTGLSMVSPATVLAKPPSSGLAEIETIVRQADDRAAQIGASRWIERRRHDMDKMSKQLIAAGFTHEGSRPRPNCGAFTYAGQRDATGEDIIASFVVCPGQPPVALVTTLLPIDRNPKRPLPLIVPQKSTERK